MLDLILTHPMKELLAQSSAAGRWDMLVLLHQVRPVDGMDGAGISNVLNKCGVLTLGHAPD